MHHLLGFSTKETAAASLPLSITDVIYLFFKDGFDQTGKYALTM
jgi:hypothetical protein